MENTNVSFYDYRALAYLKLRQYEDALEDGNQMIKIAPKNAKVRNHSSFSNQLVLTSYCNQ